MVGQLARLGGIQDLSITTNGVLLEEFAGTFAGPGCKGSTSAWIPLTADKYRQITRGGDLSRVWAGIAAARKAGLSPIKINIVAIAGFNDDEILDFARLTIPQDLQVRFIEFMPIGESSAMASGPKHPCR